MLFGLKKCFRTMTGIMTPAIMLLSVQGTSSFAQKADLPTVVIESDRDAIDIFPSMARFPDQSKSLGVHEVLKLSLQHGPKTMAWDPPVPNGNVWYVVPLLNNSGKALDFAARIEFAGIELADFYVTKLDATGLAQGSEPVAMETNANYGRFLTYPLRIPAGERFQIAFRLNSKFVHRPVRVALGSERQLLNQIQLENVAVGAYYGIAFATILFNIGLFFAGGKLKTTIYYAMFATSLLIYLLVFDGNVDSLFGAGGIWKKNILVFAGCSLLTAFLYSQSFLRTSGVIDRLRYVFAGLIAWASVVIVSALILPNLSGEVSSASIPYIEISLDLLAVVGCSIMTFSGLLALWRGYWPALYYSIGWTAISTLHSLWLMSRYGIIKATSLTYNGLHLGASVEIILMSIAVAYQIYQLRKDSANSKESEARSQAVAQTAQMVIHDIRRPFSMIDQMLDRLAPYAETSPWSDFFNQYMRTIRQQISSTKTLTSNLLDVNSSQPVHCERVHLKTLLDAAWLQVFGDHKQQTWTPVENGTDREIVCDPTKLQRVLANILENARDAQPGGGSIRITARLLTVRHKHYTRVDITNTGSKIGRGDLQKIFDVHFTKGKKNGTGLGLAICKNIIDRHEGSIGVRSTDEETTFFFTLPEVAAQPTLLQVAHKVDDADEKTSEWLEKSHRSQRIAVIDDCPFIRQLWESSVADAEVCTYESIQEFMLADEKQTDEKLRPSIIVCDLVLSDGESIERSLENLSIFAKASKVPVFISSDHNLSEAPPMITGVLQKRPYSLFELHGLAYSTTSSAIRDRRLSRDRRSGT